MIVKLLTEQHLEFLSLKEGYRGSSKTTHVKIQHYWKSHVTAHFFFFSFQLMFWSLSDDLVSAITDDKVKVYQKVSIWYICHLLVF